MSEEPNLPPLPSLGDILDRKDRFIQKVYSVIKCNKCNETFTREFEKGDYTFKNVQEEKCPKCEANVSGTITRVYSEWKDPKDSRFSLRNLKI
ncbi:MAG: hypothetical protein EU541_04275 [Promethearchaeota archaeon]|nr:MAG: hypothetical protein EU541_04275 [Candidatus Lokiarchaeota archaeon]